MSSRVLLRNSKSQLNATGRAEFEAEHQEKANKNTWCETIQAVGPRGDGQTWKIIPKIVWTN